MSTNQNIASSMIKQPFVAAIAIVAVAILIIWANQKSSPDTAKTAATSDQASLDSTDTSSDSIQLKPPTTGQDTPRIVANMNQQQQSPGSVSAPGLEGLVKGLEDKVAADPTNINNRLLLAQTYNELGMQDKALTELRSLQKDNPDNGRVNLVLGSILSKSNDQDKVKESLPLLDKASSDKTVQQYLVNMYKGDALIRMKDHSGALKHWQLALEEMPVADNRRAKLEQRINELSAIENKNKTDIQAGKG
ncbi:tetratricopeptide repeat protein [Kaarinaea lacus]